MKVVATKLFHVNDIKNFETELPNVDFWFPRTKDDLDRLEYAVEGADALLGPPPKANVLERAKETIQIVQIPWSGVDGMDFSGCRQHSIKCANSHTNSTSVAELAITLCLDVLKGTPFHDRKLREGQWHRPRSPEGFFPPRLFNGQSVGIFGFGSIGKEIYKMLSGFDLDIAALSYSGNNSTNIKMYDRQTEFHKFLSRSQILFLSAPLTGETEKLFNEGSLRHMNERSIIINVSRAQLIDVGALHNFLTKGRIWGVGLDVHWDNLSVPEQTIANEIYKMQNVVISPHRGGFIEGELPHLRGAIKNLQKVAEGRVEDIEGVINLDRGY